MKTLKNLLNNFWNNPLSSIPYLLVAGFFVFLAANYGALIRSHPRPPLASLRAMSGGYGYDFRNLFSLYSSAPVSPVSDPFENAKLEAKAAYVFDVVKNQLIFELNSEAPLPLASLTKIMTALSAKEVFPFSLLVIISKEAVLEEGDEGFIVGEEWPVLDLIDAMLISSSNDAAFALASEFNKDFNEDFVSLMNKKAKEFDLTQIYFLNATGLDLSENVSGAYGSAKDIAKLLLYAVKNHPSLMETTRFNIANINSRKFKNTNQIINELPGFMAGKTGYSDLAGGNLAIMIDKGFGQPFIIVVLGSTYGGRFTDVKTLYNLIP